jgi:hypothetical protein
MQPLGTLCGPRFAASLLFVDSRRNLPDRLTTTKGRFVMETIARILRSETLATCLTVGTFAFLAFIVFGGNVV